MTLNLVSLAYFAWTHYQDFFGLHDRGEATGIRTA